MGDVYKYYKFDFYEAEQCYEKALLIREKINFDDPLVLYKNYYSLATTNRSQYDFEKALSYGTKALELAQKSGPLQTEMTNGMIANIYRDMNQSDLAKNYYLSALELNKKTNDRETRAWYYNSLGETLSNDSSLVEAKEYFEKAYKLYTTPGMKRLSQYLSLLINMAKTYSRTGDEKKFVRITREALLLLKSLNMSSSTEASQVWLVIGSHFMNNQKLDSALYYFQKSLIASVPSFTSMNFRDNPTEDMIGVRYRINETLINKALALKTKFLQTNEAIWLEQSLAALRLAEKLLSKQRNTLDMEAAKWKFLESKYDIYEDIISSLYKGVGHLPADTINGLTFQYFEQSKSRSLADALTQTEQTRQISSDDSLLRVHADLKRKLLSAQEAVSRASEEPGSAQKIDVVRDEVIRLDKDIQSVKFAIEERYPGYFNVKYGYNSPAITNVQSIMKDKDQVLLEYFWGNESVYAIAIKDDHMEFRRIGSPDSIGLAINGLLEHLAQNGSSMNPDKFIFFTQRASELYGTLIEPFNHCLSGKDRIQIIPDGPISQIPFEILLTTVPQNAVVNYRSLDYLIKFYTIGYAYSSAMFVRNTSAKNTRSPSLLAVGFAAGPRHGREDLREIAGAEEELKALEKRFNSGKFLTGADATESNFKTMAPDFDIIHLAIHGSGDIQKSFAASLYFGPEKDSLDDGELHAFELYGLKLKASMAVLSSCESGLGKGYKGEGMLSMASAFVYSGCENILMSLWKVNDQAATRLMDDFYQHLMGGKAIDDALRQAKLNYLERSDELTADPKIWAPLIAYGNLDIVFKKDKSMTVAIGSVAVISFILLFIRFYKQYARR